MAESLQKETVDAFITRFFVSSPVKTLLYAQFEDRVSPASITTFCSSRPWISKRAHQTQRLGSKPNIWPNIF